MGLERFLPMLGYLPIHEAEVLIPQHPHEKRVMAVHVHCVHEE